MDSSDEYELPLSQQLFNLQLDLEKRLKQMTSDETVDGLKENAVFDYLDTILDNKLVSVQDFGRDMDWLNVGTSVSLDRHLRGLIVIMDFFTYCCVNCLHILPKLSAIESEFESESVAVIGVHSPKFVNEKDINNVCDALLKYNITHPVVNDPTAKIWSALDVQCWPTVMILGPNAQILFTLVGETGVDEWLHFYIQMSLKYFERKQLLINENKRKIPVKLLRDSFESQLLGFPAKISASEDQQLIAISNPKYHNIIISTINGVILHIIGGNESGFSDGSFTDARFNGPNGVVWRGNDIVFVADTENHSIREINLNDKMVKTIAGNGKLTNDLIGGRFGCEQGLNSPWDVCCADNCLFIAMAGCHQIWVLILDDNIKLLDKIYSKGCCISFAGNGAEENRNNRYPHKASFAQPSGLAMDPKNGLIYVADSESSSVRCVDIKSGCVSGIVGGDRNPQNLFAFGDRDGKGVECRLQHCLGIVLDHKNQCLFVADSYNHKIKKIDLSTKSCITIAGTGLNGNQTDCKAFECSFNEPNGLCLVDDSKRLIITDTNNHCLKVLDLDRELINEFNLIQINENKKITDNHLLKPKADFTIHLNLIDFSTDCELKLKMNLDFGETYKLTEEAKQSIRFQNPDEHLFMISHERIDFLTEMSDFKLTMKDVDLNDCLNTIYLFTINANFILCHNELNYCKQISVDFHLPFTICDKKSANTLIADLNFTMNSI